MTILETQLLGNPLINIGIFAGFVVITMFVVIRVSQGGKKRASDFYTGGAQFDGRQNGFAIAGDYLSAASFLGIVGAVALYGYDGLLYSVGFLVAWLVALLLVAEPLRNTGKYTMADVLSFRMRQKPVRTAAATSTLVISFFYLLAQMAGAGALVSLLLGISSGWGQNLVIGIVGALMVGYVLIGGMKGTTWVQMIKAVLLITGALIMTIWVLAFKGFNMSALIGAAIDKTATDAAANPELPTFDLLAPMERYTDPIGLISMGMALVLGASGLPHVLMRFYTVPTAKEARRSVTWAIGLIGAFYLFTMVLGYGAAWLVGPEAIRGMPGGANAAAPALAYHLGGAVLMAVIAGVAFATILAVVAGLAITASASFAHDIYNNVLKDGKADPAKEVRVARWTSVIIGAVAVLGGILAKEQNVAFLVSLAFAIAASANLPSILYSLYWKKFSTAGAVWSISGGLATAIVLIAFSPAVSGSPGSMFPTVDFSWFPWDSPAIFSVPAGFFLGWLGSVLKPDHNQFADQAAEMEVRSMTGAGAAGALDH
ncbi:cation acetate symporter [Tessaracoccus sp. ZS01]|uniref:solute symporter family protein n=1 Tax=Tessaracoccus sp. ZS01 TaxID=1906324 RepID=UPI00096EC83B|nr:cation acetate symporter [Tessaracoccus sp. ZS01]MCG6568726.1 cation acetate symporter [Tessaracoccus sp. ZS01]OMG51925.1 cation acetate symporter [Tessaracoccus sp. ZS01]